MPRFSRKSKRRSGDDLTLIKHLEVGTCLPCLIRPPIHSEDLLREEWGKLGDALLDKWIAEKPGSRPWAYWQFDMPGVWEYPPCYYNNRQLAEWGTELECLERFNLLTDEELKLL